MPEPIKIRAVQQGDSTEIRILLQHPMETGLRRDQASGQKIPAHFISTFTVSAHGKVLINAQLNTSIARNPLFVFQSKGLQPGDRVRVAWSDNRGEQRADEATVVAA
ncbi:thiosulfate oxidation carrier complex protein SoxZ [Accumulibacter sp.]|uniref:thiosulfate oxidation carrier complex protein SoxZ n=1 Tax=Accumulibacter sp. TaxID=2053492 RepID=UPI002633F7F5|nr:thiosulfate oxidation carrier complex protein SoxZ [Accumulibacter sp.]